MGEKILSGTGGNFLNRKLTIFDLPHSYHFSYCSLTSVSFWSIQKMRLCAEYSIFILFSIFVLSPRLPCLMHKCVVNIFINGKNKNKNKNKNDCDQNSIEQLNLRTVKDNISPYQVMFIFIFFGGLNHVSTHTHYLDRV